MRPWIVVLVISLVAAACGGAASSETTTTTTTTVVTTTTSQPTTTTTPPATVQIAGAPEDLIAVLSPIIRGESPIGVPALDAAFTAPTGDVTGEASVGVWDADRMAVIEFGDDMLAAVDDGTGWRFVAGRFDGTSVFPSLPAVYAVVGSDARIGQDVETSRADSIHLVGLPGDGSASIVGVPRDSYVPVPGRGTQRINASLSLGGPDLMMETFESVTGVDLAGYTLTGFAGFEDLVSNILGGLEIDIPAPFTDKAAQASFPEAGSQAVDGAGALAFARSRKAFAGGDFTRQLHGGLVLIGGAAAVKLRGPMAIPPLLEKARRSLWTDLDAGQLLELSLAVQDLDILGITNVVVEGRSVTRNGASVVDLNPSAYDVFADLGDDARLSGG